MELTSAKIGIVLCFMLFLGLKQDKTLTWQQDQKLTWSNYQGDVDPNNDAVALTASGITFSYAINESNKRFVNFEATVESHFYPEKSWYKEALCDSAILAHEQLHFDITELHARKFRSQLAQLVTTQAIQADLRRLHRNINRDMAKMQNTYDLETNNSMDVEQQAFWANFVTAELEKYKAFQSK